MHLDFDYDLLTVIQSIVIPCIDNLTFTIADYGFFGAKLCNNADRIKRINYEGVDAKT